EALQLQQPSTLGANRGCGTCSSRPRGRNRGGCGTARLAQNRDAITLLLRQIGQFVKEIESQLGWTTQLPWSAGSIDQRRFDALRLLRQVPAITELAQLDASGK